MTDFPTLLYTSTRETPTLSYAWSMKKVPLSGGAYPYRPSYGVPLRGTWKQTNYIISKSSLNFQALIHVRLLKWGVVRNEKLEVKQKRRKEGKREKLYLSIPHKKRQEKPQVAQAQNMSIGEHRYFCVFKYASSQTKGLEWGWKQRARLGRDAFFFPRLTRP